MIEIIRIDNVITIILESDKQAEELEEGLSMHRVEFRPSGWAVEHSLQCRIDGMFDCKVDKYLRNLYPREISNLKSHYGYGRFNVVVNPGTMAFEKVSDDTH